MRQLAIEDRSSQITKLQSLLTSFPSLLLSSQSTATSSSASSSTDTSSLSALMELRAGVGGSESSLFVGDLVRMYIHYASEQGWSTQVSQGKETESGGLKDASIEVKGEGCYETLRWESGVHRVQRVPETESGGRVHTSTCGVIVSAHSFGCQWLVLMSGRCYRSQKKRVQKERKKNHYTI
jgi:peptide chain release factor 1